MKNNAIVFAMKHHGKQKRKYTNEPYINHCINVGNTLYKYGVPDYVVVAAILHDVLEDTSCKPEEIENEFGLDVLRLVLEVTDISKPEDGNRAKRKEIDKQHLAKASVYGQTIKLADLIDNAPSILRYDPNFAKVYMKEKEDLLKVLVKGDYRLYDIAKKSVEAYE